MLWRLWKPRQLVKISIPGTLTEDEHKTILRDLDKRMGKEYIPLLVMSPESTEIQIEIIR